MRFIFLLFVFILMPSPIWALEIKSDAFENAGMIPIQYSCDGSDSSPYISWEDAPSGVKSLALICDDPDAPSGNWVHWVIYNIPADKNYLDTDLPKERILEDGSIQGINDFRQIGYNGPCPPPGKAHRYFFTLYALDTVLSLSGNAEKSSVLKAIEGHVLAEAKTVGLYRR